jgi:hypothetical protein
MFSDMPCGSLIADWQYRWQRDTLKFLKVVLPPLAEMEQAPWCTRYLASTLSAPKYLKNKAALNTYKQMLGLPFIQKDLSERSGEPFNVEKERFRLALFLSDQGDKPGADQQLRLIRASTDASLAKWRKDALAYYAVRHNPQALFQFCLTSKTCETFLSLSRIIALIPPNRYAEVETLLKQMGINYHSSGSFDFDQNGQPEKWLFFRSGYCNNELLIVANGENEIKSRSIQYLCVHKEDQEVKKVEIRPLVPSGGLPGYQIVLDDEEISSGKFLYWPLDQEDPTIDYRETGKLLDTIQNKMLLGQVTPAEARNQLKTFQNLPHEPDYYPLSGQAANVLYLLGLTYELDGMNKEAAQTYLELWQTYPDSPYAMMAYAKLEPAP